MNSGNGGILQNHNDGPMCGSQLYRLKQADVSPFVYKCFNCPKHATPLSPFPSVLQEPPRKSYPSRVGMTTPFARA
jgi:hypothetical protein